MTKGYLSPRASAAAYKSQVGAQVARNTLGLKSELISQLDKLERSGHAKDAKAFATIIGKLESFQLRYL